MEPELRHAARALVLDPLDRVLLVRLEDGSRGWWVTPGGGLEGTETHEEALRRELEEEAGLGAVRLGPCVWVREHTFPWKGRLLRQQERIHLVRVADLPEARPSLSDAQLRREGLVSRRWWTLDELLRSVETFAPSRLPRLVAELLARGAHDEPLEPLDVGA